MVDRRLTSLGMMSGTSLDGVDLALCSFVQENDRWSYKILATEFVPYHEEQRSWLRGLETTTGTELAAAHATFGQFLGEAAARFCGQQSAQPDFISSHGHTIYHQPDAGFTWQLGSGAALAAASGIPVVSDFRSTDVALGGQGAPLVPIGDQLLFSDYEYCLNIGGIANLSFEHEGKRIAYDICSANQLLNELAGREGLAYDRGGELASSGNLIPEVLEQLDGLPFFQLPYPKSLGREWTVEEALPILNQQNASTADLLRTTTEHISRQIGRALPEQSSQSVLITGGGAHNAYLIKQIEAHTPAQILLPDTLTIDFKEALIFAFLGALRWTNKTNVLASVTGASKDHCAGCIYLP